MAGHADVRFDGELRELRPAGALEKVATDDGRKTKTAEHEPELSDVLGTCGVQESEVDTPIEISRELEVTAVEEETEGDEVYG